MLTLREVAYGVAGRPLLDGASLVLERGERVCLVGRNGAGKSTLLRLVAGELNPDHGEVLLRPGARVGVLPQALAGTPPGDVYDVVAAALGDRGQLLARYHDLGVQLAQAGDEARLLARLAEVQHALEHSGGWQLRHRVEALLDRLALRAEAPFAQLSGGERRRVLLARALVTEPDLLLLDEPTNHLDLPAIAALEEALLAFPGALLFVTHDRALLQRLATRIVELDRGKLTSFPGDWADFRRRRDAELEAETRREREFDRVLAREEAWIRQGIKARRTRNEGRVRALEALRAERRQRRARVGQARLEAATAAPSGKRVLEAAGLRYSYDGVTLVDGLDLSLMQGDKLGLIGPNGCGKTTLIRLLLGELAPDAGRVEHGSGLEIAYFDQHRAPLDEESTLLDVVGHGREQVEVGGRSRHVISYLQDFLFTPEQVRAPLRTLSGGERSRGLLAQLFSRPSNLLVMDEPTNDLDVETLELLEELLADYPGTLLLVSHDRAFLDNVVTSTLVFAGNGRIEEYVGGYSDWLRQRPPPPEAPRAPAKPRAASAPRPKPLLRKLGYREQQELAALPARIETLEGEQAALQQALAEPQHYRDGGEAARELGARLQQIEAELATAYARWEELEAAGRG
ncbi:MAG TPA: ATP-binding cassette domain-containing protein [Gammaproteobacteria bacterium]